MCHVATELTGITAGQLCFQDLDYHNEFDGVWACASLLYIKRKELPTVLKKVSDALKPGGISSLSFKYGSFHGKRDGRYFSDMSQENLAWLCSGETGLSLIKYFLFEDVRDSHVREKWLNIFASRTENMNLKD